ncbi:DMT family transporter [Paenibacillus hemerocallicola]|nr:DMT family transporter [Paenibacillus hemerocallicola]
MFRSYILLLLCVTMWGSNIVINSMLLVEMTPFILGASRLVFASLFLLAYAAATRRLVKLTKRDWLFLVPLGFFGTFMSQLFYFAGLSYADATTAALIHSLGPVTIAVLSAFFLGEAFTMRLFVGSVCAIAGIYFAVGGSSGIQASLGVIYTFVSMVSVAVSYILVSKWMRHSGDPFMTSACWMVIGTCMLLPFSLMSESLVTFIQPLWVWLLIALTSIVGQGICFVIWNGQITKVGTGKTSLFLYLQPVVTMIAGYLILGTRIAGSQLTGALLVIIGVAVATLRTRQTKHVSEMERSPTASGKEKRAGDMPGMMR